ncbi:alpha-taxilin [Tribolium madens]|uniref:alpha-taxilin n=1 Tax=Tribolium madens TaxID=41895 RepID=UPI001CF74E3E|nr:alpha-taxilin [Tribolium madens]XP_044257094.1 alpha-taxilin [Tribolium madens]XP_044257095.1 alpha-taxilin [Tribolium madens]XP_044257096.1 alpha-taxilin [Tribolium madens]
MEEEQEQGAAAAAGVEGATAAAGDQGAAVAVTSAVFRKKHRKKDPKSWENISKVVAAMDEASKLSYIEEKYQDLHDQVRLLTGSNQQLLKHNSAIQRERDHHQSELAKSVVARARLENLCRELQKQNKQIKEENLVKIKEEEERRKEVSSKFADKLSDINNMMDENKEKSEKLREENLRMTARLADLFNQFKKREEDIARMSHQLELERKFSQATISKMDLEMKAQKEVHAKEQELMKCNLEKSEANCTVLLETVKGLQDHIDVYKNQYQDFESTMTKSANVFDNFKTEIANMTKQVAALEKEAQFWKNKFNDSMKALIEMSELKKNQDLYLQSLERKVEQLNKLCRQIQVDRSHYLKLLKSYGIEPTPSQPQEKTEEAKKASPTMTKKEQELHLLKENLKAVQDQLARLNVEGSEKTETKKTDEQTTSQDEAPPCAKCTPQTIIAYPDEADFVDVCLVTDPEEDQTPKTPEESQ